MSNLPPTELPPVNVIVSDDEAERILREDRRWSGPRLMALCAVTLGIALVALYIMSNLPISQG